MRIVWTRRYLIELAAIGDHIARDSPRAAAKLVNDIHSTIAELVATNPFIGRSGEIAGTRELVVPGTPYVVAYRVGDTAIEVLFVQHGARQWPDKA